MRIRNFRIEDIPTLAHLQQLAAQADDTGAISEDTFAAWFLQPALEALSNAFVITDDDDELNTWGQAGTLEGIEGEIIGYSIVLLQPQDQAYHLLCQGTVDPQQRGRHAGRALLICALNRARIVAAEFEFEAEQAGIPVYFEALLPTQDAAAGQLAEKCEMQLVDEAAAEGLALYRREL